MREFLLDNRGDMVERGLIMAAIVVAAVFLWVSIGQKLAVKLGIVDASISGGQTQVAGRPQGRHGRRRGHSFRRWSRLGVGKHGLTLTQLHLSSSLIDE